MADPIPPDTRRTQTQLKFAVLFLIAVNVAILVKVFLPSASSSKTADTNTIHEALPTSEIAEKQELAPAPVRQADPIASSSSDGPTIIRKSESAPIVLPVPTPPSVTPVRTTSRTTTTGGFTGNSSSVAFTGGFSVSGTVRLDGTPPPEREITPIKADAKCSASHSEPVFTRGYVVSKDRGLANVVVTVDEGLEAKAFPIPATKALVDQIGCMYEPYVTAAMAGQEVVFRNSDPFMHNVNAMAKANQGFNFAQSTEGQETTKTFTKRENVKIVCNVHPWMAGYIFVFEHPFFAVTDTNGNFQIPPGLASGQYSLRFTHLKAGDISLPVRIEPGMAAKVECSYTVPQ